MVKQLDTLDEFQDLLKSTSGLVVVDFYAQWCGPCKKFQPKFAKLADEYPDVTFVKIDVDVNEDVADLLEITTMPTFMLFKDRRKVSKVLGVNPRKLISKIEKEL